MVIKAVVFDVGETLINETRLWNAWSAYLGVEPDVFHSALDEVIANGEHHRAVFERFSPGFDSKNRSHCARAMGCEATARISSNFVAGQPIK